MGTIALGATVLALEAFRAWGPMVELGEGGLERWIVYPIVLWSEVRDGRHGLGLDLSA